MICTAVVALGERLPGKKLSYKEAGGKPRITAKADSLGVVVSAGANHSRVVSESKKRLLRAQVARDLKCNVPITMTLLKLERLARSGELGGLVNASDACLWLFSELKKIEGKGTDIKLTASMLNIIANLLDAKNMHGKAELLRAAAQSALPLH